MRVFKSRSTIAVNRMLGRAGESLWQRGYHDRVIRNEREYAAIASYLQTNPAQWESDRDNPRLDSRRTESDLPCKSDPG